MVLHLKRIEKSLSYAATAAPVAFSTWILPLYFVKYLFFISVIRWAVGRCSFLSKTLSLLQWASLMADSPRDLARELVNMVTQRSSKKQRTGALADKDMISKLGLRQGFLSLAKETMTGIASKLVGNQHRRVYVSKPGRKKKLALPCDSLLGGWRLRLCKWCE